MLEFMQTIGKGIIQGVKQYIDNDLSSYVPFFIIALVILVGYQVMRNIRKYKSK